MAKGGSVYITANRYRGGMCVGVSADAIRREWKFALIEPIIRRGSTCGINGLSGAAKKKAQPRVKHGATVGFEGR